MSKLFSGYAEGFKCMILLGIEITWVHVPRLPVLHLDSDQWKCTMFTNKCYISACHFDKILQMNIFTV